MNKQKQSNFIIFLLAFVIIQINSTVYAIQDTPKKQEKNNISLEKIQEKKLVSKIDFESIWDKAKEHSYDLKIADFNILISKQDIRGARSEYFPKLIASAGTEYTKNYRDNRDTTVMSIGESFINPYTRYQSIMGITLTYNLFDFGVRKGNLDIAKEADKLTILFDIKKSASEGESAVGDALYVIGKGQTNLKHGIQMDGIDTIKTSDGKGGYTDITAPTNEIISDVQGWLKANESKGYDSVADAIKANDADLANLIAKFAPSQPQA